VKSSEELAERRPFCLVKVHIQPGIEIWVGLPLNGHYNDRFMALGGGGYAGNVWAPTRAVEMGYVGATTNTGHTGSRGIFGMLHAGVPNKQLQTDFGWRSQHLMAVVSKRLITLFYGRPPRYSYWYGCSTGGRQGLASAQRFPGDYDGVLAGAPAINFEKLGVAQTWPFVVARDENHGQSMSIEKMKLATSAAITACDAYDGIVDGVLRDPRSCHYNAEELVCKPGGSKHCLSPGEASAINKIWAGPQNPDGTQWWYGIPRGASLSTLAGPKLHQIPYDQARYWVELDPNWNVSSLVTSNFPAFFNKTVLTMGPGPTPSDNPKSISAFRDAGHKVLAWHGWDDQMIMPQGTIDYFNEVTAHSDNGDPSGTRNWFRLFMAPGVAHCGMDYNPMFEALVDWVEHGIAPDSIVVPHITGNASQLLCPHPSVSIYVGHGSKSDPANFHCGENPFGPDKEHCNARINRELVGVPFIASPPVPAVE